LPGIYLHIPFCKQACIYCDFHFSTQLKTTGILVDALCREIELRKDYLTKNKLDTIYFGGGTPSVLTLRELTKIFNSLSEYFTWDKDAEITFECNPDDLSKEKLRELKELGINRLSIGLQSFDEEELKWMNRAHTAKQSFECVRRAQEEGFDTVSIDLIYGSKFQSREVWQNTLQTSVELGVPHISSYNLTIEEKTALGSLAKKKKEPLVDEEKSAKQFIMMSEFLQAKGYLHYEISNFAKPGMEAKHNSNYWKGHSYLGIGPSAHSFNGESRQWNVSNNAAYIKALNTGETFFETEILTADDKYNEYILTSLRTMWGCDISRIESMGEKYFTHFTAGIKKLIPQHVSTHHGIYTLTTEGKLLADKIAAGLFI